MSAFFAFDGAPRLRFCPNDTSLQLKEAYFLSLTVIYILYTISSYLLIVFLLFFECILFGVVKNEFI